MASSVQSVDFNSRVQRVRPLRLSKLGDILKHRQLVSSRELQTAIKFQASNVRRFKLGEILIAHGMVDPDDVRIALREQLWRNQGFWVID